MVCVDEEAPSPLKSAPAHPLLSEQCKRMPTIDDFIEMRHSVGGTAQAEKLKIELNAAGKFNRGPPGVSNSSRLHFDLLVDRDSKIDFADFLNFQYNERS